MPKPPSTWRAIELKVCRFLGWERTHWALPDGRGQGYAAEIKHGKQIPKWLLNTWEQAQTNSGDMEPICVIHPPRWPIPKSLVVIELEHFKELMDERTD